MTEQIRLKLGQLKVNENNPRTITAERFHRLVDSLLVFPRMLDARRIVVDGSLIVIGGNMRTQALQFIALMTQKEIARRLAGLRDFNKMQPDEQAALLSYWEDFNKNPFVDVYDASGWTDEERRQFIVKDNASSGVWDFDELANKFNEADLPAWGVDVWQMDAPNSDTTPPTGHAHEDVENAVTIPEPEPEGNRREMKTYDDATAAVEVTEDEPDDDVEIKHRVKDGELWAFGTHRLYCGDCTKAESYAALLNGQKATLVFTDPPYGMSKESEGVANDNLHGADLLAFNKKWLPLAIENATFNASVYIWGNDVPLMEIYYEILRPLTMTNALTFRQIITWDKDTGFGQTSGEMRMYSVASEKCLFFVKGAHGFNNNADHFEQETEGVRAYMESEAKAAGLTPKRLKEICGCEMWSHWFTRSQFALITRQHYDELREAFPQNFRRNYEDLRNEYESGRMESAKKRAYFNNTHDNMNDIWHIPRARYTDGDNMSKTNELHATPKPIALCARAIKSSSRPLDIVLDVFGGSGSTLIACEQLQRACYIMEIQPRYCDVILQRWERLTGQIATKIK